MAPRSDWTAETAHSALMQWAKTTTMLKVSSGPSPGLIQRLLGLSDAEEVLEYVRVHIGGVRADDDEVVTRVRCWSWKSRGFQSVAVGDWRTGRARCDCKICGGQPTIVEAAPYLADRLLDPEKLIGWERWRPDAAQIPITVWWPFLCPNATDQDDVGHLPIETSTATLMQGGWVCERCWQHHGKQPGDVIEDWPSPDLAARRVRGLVGARVGPAESKREREIIKALTPLLTVPLLVGVRILLRRDTQYAVAALKPDAVLPDLKIAIEIDGGTGRSHGYSFHDTAQGKQSDEARDQALADVGWKVIRVRDPHALRLDTPATIIYCGRGTRVDTVAKQVASAIYDDTHGGQTATA